VPSDSTPSVATSEPSSGGTSRTDEAEGVGERASAELCASPVPSWPSKAKNVARRAAGARMRGPSVAGLETSRGLLGGRLVDLRYGRGDAFSERLRGHCL